MRFFIDFFFCFFMSSTVLIAVSSFCLLCDKVLIQIMFRFFSLEFEFYFFGVMLQKTFVYPHLAVFLQRLCTTTSPIPIALPAFLSHALQFISMPF